MKTMKIVSLALAGMMTVQTTMSYAQASRVGDIGNKQIAVAQQQLSEVKTQIAALDKSLEDAANSIKNREQGGRTNRYAMVGAGLGVVCSLLILKGNGSAYVDDFVGLGFGLLGALTTTGVSLGMSSLSAYLKPDANTKSAEVHLANAQKDIQTAIVVASTSNEKTLPLLIQLDGAFSRVQSSLAEYKKDENYRSEEKLMANLVQAAGMAVTVISLTSRREGVYLSAGGTLLTIGNILRITTGLSKSQADKVLTEIEKTRRYLQASAVALN